MHPRSVVLLISVVIGALPVQAGEPRQPPWEQPVRGAALGGDCDDTHPLVNPGRTEVAGNWIDDDCDGLADEDAQNNPSDDLGDHDADGVSLAVGDCNDTDDGVYPTRPETPVNLIDDDCDGLADESEDGTPSPDVADHDDDSYAIGFDSIFFSGFEIVPPEHL